MKSHDAQVKALQKQVRARKAVFENAVTKLEDLIEKRKNAKPGTPEYKLLLANRKNLKDAQGVIAAYEEADDALGDACCQNDLNCEIDVG